MMLHPDDAPVYKTPRCDVWLAFGGKDRILGGLVRSFPAQRGG
jgi:hypothetical protein